MTCYRSNLRTALIGLMLTFLSPGVTAGLVAHWTGDNTTADSSGNGHTGSLINGATYGAGVLGQAFSFDGVNDYVTVPGNLALQPSTISVAMWVSAAPGGGLRLLADSSHGGTGGTSNQGGWAVQLNANNTLDFAYGNGVTFPHLSTTSVVADNSFHHVVTLLDGPAIRVYVDGVLNNSGIYSGTPIASTANSGNIRLGNHFQFSRPLNGLLDDVRIYDHALSLSEIGVLSGTSTVPEPSTFAGLLLVSIAGLFRHRRRRCSVG